MRGAKEEDKRMGPLFPRFHVNDADKGGPRAPPRNKMALYEQFSTPSQRLNSASFMLPLPPNNASIFVPSDSSSEGCGHESNVFSPIYLPSYAPVHTSRKVVSPSDQMHHNMTRMEYFRKSANNASSSTSVGTISLAECNAEDCRMKKLDDLDDLMVPTFNQSGNDILSKRDAPIASPAKLTSLNSHNPHKGSSTAFRSTQSTSSSKPLEASDTKSRNFGRTQRRKKPEEISAVEEPIEMSAHHRVADSSGTAKVSIDKNGMSNVHCSEKSLCTDVVLCQESYSNADLSQARNSDDIANAEIGNISAARNELCSKESSARILNSSGNCNQENGEKESVSLDAERKDEASEGSIVDCILGLEISPDEVVGVIGPKHFSKAKGAIEKQQRVFAIQVFELHRLIEVQKLLAASPHLLLEGNSFLNKSPAKIPRKMPNISSQLNAIREQDVSQKPNTNVEPAAEKNVRHPTSLTCEDGFNSLRRQAPNVKPCSTNSPPVSAVPENKPTSLCLYPPANQWLVTVMSLSGGLYYEPFTGPCPPPGGFLAPIYGGCAPLAVAPVAGDVMNPAYGYPASHLSPNMGLLSGPPAISRNYFPMPYGLQAMNPTISTSVVEQIRSAAASQACGQMDHHSRSSYNMPYPRGEELSSRHWKLQASKDHELQESTASSPTENLFPVDPAINDLARPLQSSKGNSQTRVIKVVPRNARSASESAARIFRSIQEERQQQES